ncbi:site-specific integrase [Listeria seeligeri]|uniref:site-specific integrase n=1 Tax=Listeria seeligeri TaxID=1640 RepID=UPI0010F4008F|nr:site-specific integrase [Listeria seeligeri]MBC1725022.1 site-specific integrase [Listeria seeligeri]MBC1731438.1 site-specific integrase [Listeria seeligeri]MBC1737734.1 site-specific integrase [Listeria seeligeri]MBC1753417.1 site-specific integrase [Listeria seeligeri]MBC1786964.1 site-specific integrase [Listeria seeligeri]
MSFWTLEEFQRFITALYDEEFIYKLFYFTAYFTGLRVGELLALKWDDIDFNRNEIHVNETLSRVNGQNIVTSPKSTTSNRYITINNKLAQLLFTWKKEQKNLLQSFLLTEQHLQNATVFQHNIEIAQRETFVTKKIQRICKRCAVHPIRLHDFRHSHVALLIDNGENITVIKERMGHASITTTIDTYGHLFPNKQREMSDKLDFL